MKKLLILFLYILIGVGCLVGCGNANGSVESTNKKDTEEIENKETEQTIIEDKDSKGLNINSIAKMNYYLGKALIATNSRTNNSAKKAYRKFGNNFRRFNSDEETQENINDEFLNQLPEDIEEPYNGTKEIESIDEGYNIRYKDGSVAYYMSIENYTISFAFSFKFELDDENTYLASKIGTGTIDCVITDFGIGMASFKNGDKYYCCLQDSSMPGFVGNTFTFNFGREYVGMYFCKGDQGNKRLGNITFDNLLDLSLTTVSINGGDSYNSCEPKLDNDCAVFTQITPITLTWEEYIEFITSTLDNGLDIEIDEEQNELYKEWQNKLKFNNATIYVDYGNQETETYYYIDGEYYTIDGGIPQSIIDFKTAATQAILNNLDSLVQDSDGLYHFNDVAVTCENGEIIEIFANIGINFVINNIGTTSLPQE